MMDKLQMAGNELVPVYVTDTGEKVVYGTELHGVLGVKTAYKDWSVRRFHDVDALENEDFEVLLKNEQNQKGGRPSLNHIIKLDTAKEMAMLERNEMGRQVRRYFIQVEKKYKQQTARPLSPLDQLRLQGAAIMEADGKIDAVNRDLQAFKRDIPVLGIEAEQITRAVHDACVSVMGGGHSRAYMDRSLRGKVYSDIYKGLKMIFGITSYKELRRSQRDMAIRMVHSYKAPYALAEQIKYYNTQI